ncbi:hypothetical protein [Nesterenkonia marinintestina]|uniref:hypothetical protein n=1 Tax=Nesterenkonia marinintestina TaxID=2979865 RepID=UPI0021BF221F|nr:hypothetical protein [Nesterenkonia sp. GX14115]
MTEVWRQARLIPTPSTKNTTDQEIHATSALLSILTVVPSFAHAVLKPCGAPLGRVRANVESFVEVAFEDKLKKQTSRPDGLIRVKRGNKTWIALVEVKTQSNKLEADQVERYMDIARDEGYDAVITISNEIPPVLGAHPLKLNARKLRSTPVVHFSWTRIISLAIMERDVHGVEDPEQAWILSELIRYLEHDNSGTLEFSDMGSAWSEVRSSIRNGIVRKTDDAVAETALKFDGLVRFTCFTLSQRLGADVTPKLPRRQRDDPQERAAALAAEIERDSSMSATISVPDTVADLEVRCDLRGRQIHTFATIPASGQVRNQSRVNWLLRPIPDERQELVIEAKGNRRTHAATIADFRGELKHVLPSDFPQITSFTVTQVQPMGSAQTTRAKDSFITSFIEAVSDFYIGVLQPQRVWSAPAPKYKKSAPEIAEEETYSSQEIGSGEPLQDESTDEPDDT